MSSFVRHALRRIVIERASRLCEYCLIHEDDTYLGCQVEDGFIRGKTEVGDATAMLLQFNVPERVEERIALIAAGRFPAPVAASRIDPDARGR